MAFDLMNSRYTLATGYKSPVTKSNLSKWWYQCNKIVSYLFELKDEHGHSLREKHCKTVIWGFAFSIHSVMAITQDMLTCTDCPLKYVLTYKFCQDHIELLFKLHVGSPMVGVIHIAGFIVQILNKKLSKCELNIKISQINEVSE